MLKSTSPTSFISNLGFEILGTLKVRSGFLPEAGTFGGLEDIFGGFVEITDSANRNNNI